MVVQNLAYVQAIVKVCSSIVIRWIYLISENTALNKRGRNLNLRRESEHFRTFCDVLVKAVMQVQLPSKRYVYPCCGKSLEVQVQAKETLSNVNLWLV